jgi:hypothetical protein
VLISLGRSTVSRSRVCRLLEEVGHDTGVDRGHLE